MAKLKKMGNSKPTPMSSEPETTVEQGPSGKKDTSTKDNLKIDEKGLFGKREKAAAPASEKKKKRERRKFAPREEIAEAREKRRQALRQGREKT